MGLIIFAGVKINAGAWKQMERKASKGHQKKKGQSKHLIFVVNMMMTMWNLLINF